MSNDSVMSNDSHASRPPQNPSSRQLLEDRIQARRLLKQLRSDDPDLAQQAASRFRNLRTLKDLKAEEVISRRERLQLKHALAVIAQERGFGSWKALKDDAETVLIGEDLLVDEDLLMYEKRMDVLLNRWFSQHQYDQALSSLVELGGFLLPYKHHFFICEEEGIRILGLDPEDPDWRKIGWNWIAPKDREAHQRLRAKRLTLLRS